MESSLAVVKGPVHSPLWLATTLGDVVNRQAAQYGSKEVAIFPWQGVRMSYSRLAERGKLVAKALLHSGVKPNECVAILAGNRFEYLEVVVGGALIGCSVLVLHTTYKPWELQNSLHRTSRWIHTCECEDLGEFQLTKYPRPECRVLFLASEIGNRNMDEHFERLNSPSTRSSLTEVARVITLGKDHGLLKTSLNENYETFLSSAPRDVEADILYNMATESVKPWDVASLQFTSGTVPPYFVILLQC